LTSSPPPDSFARSRRLALAALFLSGAAGLVHEVVWAKLLARLIGSTAHAQVLVLALFMGGLAIGAVRYGRRAPSGAAGLRLYGRLEVLIGVYGIALPALAWLAATLHDAAAPFVFGMPALALALRFLLAAAIALLPAIWMGGTLPVLAACLTRSAEETRGRVGALYAVNNLGAVLGSLTAGFVLLSVFGTLGSLVAAAALNFVSAAIGYRLARDESAAVGESGAEAEPVRATTGKTPGIEAVSAGQAKVALFVLALSGYAAMGYEAVMSRIIALAFGGTTYSFTVMLAAFITGIGLGSALIAGVRVRRTLELLGILQLAVGAAFLAATPALARLPYWTGLLRIELQEPSFGFQLFQLGKAGLCLLVLLIPTACLGAGFPLVAALQVRSVEAVGSTVGRVYAWNTVGNVLGVLVTGLIVLPTAGLGAAFGSCVAVSFLAGFLGLGASAGPLGRRLPAPAAALIVLTLFLVLGGGWLEPLQRSVNHLRLRASSGEQAAPSWGAPPSSSFEAWKEAYVQDLERAPSWYFGEDANATVLAIGDSESAILAVNSKPDASVQLTGSDMSTQQLLGHLPALLSRERGSALVIGYGSGVTVGSLLQHPFERVDVVEISSAVLEAHEVFKPFNHDALGDPRVEVFAEDGRTFLRTVPRRYDVITSEPSNPWLAGIGALFTREFFVDARDRLEPGGVFCAWIHQYEQSEEAVTLVLRTMADAFPSIAIYRATPTASDILLIGRKMASQPDFPEMESRFDEPAVWADLQRIGALNLSSLLVMQSASDERLRRILPDGPVNREFHERLEYMAPKGVFLGLTSGWITERDALVRRRLEQTGAWIDAYIGWRSDAGDPVSQVELEVAAAFAGEALSPGHPLSAGLRQLVDEQAGTPVPDGARSPARRLLPAPDSMGFELAYQTGARYHQRNDPARALPYYLRAAELRPDDANVCFNLAKALYSLERWVEVAEVYERCLAASPGSVELARNLATIWVRLGRSAEAESLLEELTRRAPDPIALTMLGTLRQSDGRLDAAARLFERAVEQSAAEYWPAVEKLAVVLESSGRVDEARALVDRGLAASPGQARLLALRSRLAAP
jgi:spermidine synthase